MGKMNREKICMAYPAAAAIHHASDVVEDGDGSVGWEEGEEVLDEGNPVFLLLSRGIGVGQIQGNVMTTHHAHQSSIVKVFQAGLRVGATTSLMRFLADVDSFVRDLQARICFRLLWRLLPRLLDFFAYLVDGIFGNDILRLEEGWGIPFGS